jgi:hypothetical protein
MLQMESQIKILRHFFWGSFFVRYRGSKDYYSSIGFAFGIVAVTLYCFLASITGLAMILLKVNHLFDQFVLFNGGYSTLYYISAISLIMYLYIRKFVNLKNEQKTYSTNAFVRKNDLAILLVPSIISIVGFIWVALAV